MTEPFGRFQAVSAGRKERGALITQYGVLAYEIAGEEPRFLLITSRETRRWVIPRGNPIRGLAPHHSAAQEAYEEAGLVGLVGPEEVGAYRYRKRRAGRGSVAADVHVFPMLVASQAGRFPERDERERRWFARAEAAAAVDEPGLRQMILAFAPRERTTMEPYAPARSRRAKLLKWLRRPLRL